MEVKADARTESPAQRSDEILGTMTAVKPGWRMTVKPAIGPGGFTLRWLGRT
jgi:hypothetical protein